MRGTLKSFDFLTIIDTSKLVSTYFKIFKVKYTFIEHESNKVLVKNIYILKLLNSLYYTNRNKVI